MPLEPLNNEKELLIRIAQGDESAFTEVYNRYSNSLYGYALKIVNSEFWAEEVVQTLFMQIWSNRDSLRIVGNLQPYLFRMAANRSIDLIRKNELEVKMQYHLAKTGVDLKNETENQFDFRASEQLLKRAIGTLPAQSRLVYQLKNEGLQYDEIANRLQISRNTVRNHMALALQKIRAFMLKNGGFMALLVYYAAR